MRFNRFTLTRWAGALLCGAALLVGAGLPARAQGRHGQRKVEQRALREHQREEREQFRDRWRNTRRDDNTWRDGTRWRGTQQRGYAYGRRRTRHDNGLHLGWRNNRNATRRYLPLNRRFRR
ncbi:MAG TPA: hypothetical protein VF546_05475 [Pyrinomonadaceae bacterium]|jgi:hypothetical protein